MRNVTQSGAAKTALKSIISTALERVNSMFTLLLLVSLVCVSNLSTSE